MLVSEKRYFRSSQSEAALPALTLDTRLLQTEVLPCFVPRVSVGCPCQATTVAPQWAYVPVLALRRVVWPWGSPCTFLGYT